MGSGKATIIDIGCNRGYFSVALLDLLVPGFGDQTRAFYASHLASKLYTSEADACGVCSDCKQQHSSSPGSSLGLHPDPLQPGANADGTSALNGAREAAADAVSAVGVHCFEPSWWHQRALRAARDKVYGSPDAPRTATVGAGTVAAGVAVSAGKQQQQQQQQQQHAAAAAAAAGAVVRFHVLPYAVSNFSGVAQFPANCTTELCNLDAEEYRREAALAALRWQAEQEWRAHSGGAGGGGQQQWAAQRWQRAQGIRQGQGQQRQQEHDQPWGAMGDEPLADGGTHDGLQWARAEAATGAGATFAAGARTGAAASGATASAGAPAAPPAPVTDSLFDVDVTTVDDYVRRNGIERVDVLKIDTEGFDPAVLAGAYETLRQRRVEVLVFEYHDLWRRSGSTRLPTCLGYLSRLGFACYFDGPALHRLTEGCWDPRLEIREWSNVVCALRGRPLERRLADMSALRQRQRQQRLATVSGHQAAAAGATGGVGKTTSGTRTDTGMEAGGAAGGVRGSGAQGGLGGHSSTQVGNGAQER
ncbi:hypothetical protein HYH02_011663 [Chlamydomonas schloesseri]|uniref:Methyltransferase FkbM domain-containing protein n=1 Tax=Chlamydomonas schloesseri TaxID=2026947 RepID=A0A835T9A9_9CHLO|nr:hypothetical protein HYH02_011663 [Chlamydomonas schloesseri]|eukprot:KAG2436159.1 hypothetical protein HYH02_011663 [Chlamydomonas schloesseri]